MAEARRFLTTSLGGRTPTPLAKPRRTHLCKLPLKRLLGKPEASPAINVSRADSQPALPSRPPGGPHRALLSADPSHGRTAYPPCINHAFLSCYGGHPLKCSYLLATYCCTPCRGTGGSHGLSLLLVVPPQSLQVQSHFNVLGPSFTHKPWAGWGPALL